MVASDVDPTLPFTIGKNVAYPAACRAGADCNRVLMFSATVTNWTGEYRLWGSTTWKVTTSLRSYPGSMLESLTKLRISKLPPTNNIMAVAISATISRLCIRARRNTSNPEIGDPDPS